MGSVALTIALGGLGGTLGAVYNPLFDILPTTEFPPAMPFTLQLYVFEGLFEPDVTLNCWLCVVSKVALEGVTTKPGWMLTAA